MSPLNRRERDLVKCEDMRIHAERAQEFLGACPLERFLRDELLQAAVIRCVEVVGEATRHVSEETQERRPEIPWHSIIGMRNVLIHNYGVVNPERVFSVVTEHLPVLVSHIGRLIAALEKDVGWEDRNFQDQSQR